MPQDPRTLHERVDELLRASDLVDVVRDMEATLRRPGVSLLERPLCRIRTFALRRTDAGLRAELELTLCWRRAGSVASDATLERTLRAIVDGLYAVAGVLPELEDVIIDYGVTPTAADNLPDGIYDVALLYVRAA